MIPRVVVAGAGGGVGASLGFNLLLSPFECEVVMVDARQAMLHSHLWDLEQVLEQIPPSCAGSVRAGDLDDIDGADILVLTAHGTGAGAAAGLHPQRFAAAAHGHRTRSGRVPGPRRGVDGGRTR